MLDLPIFDTLGLSGPLYEFIEGAGLGVGCGMCIIGFLLASGKLDQFREFKKDSLRSNKINITCLLLK